MKSKRVFIATTTFGEEDSSVLAMLQMAKIEYVLNPYRRRLNEEEIKNMLGEGKYQGLLAGLEPLTKNVLIQAKDLKVISRVGVGLDNVDQVAAKSLKIKVYNTPGVLTDAVAELSLGLMLAALRKISFLDCKMHSGVWEKKSGFLLKGKTVGLVGFGNIGQRVADLVLAFGAQAIFTDLCKVKKSGVKQVSFTELLKKADIISLHSSGKDCLIGSKEILMVKPGVILVNTARGMLIDEKALVEGLHSGTIGCAALDVFCEEPYQGELIKEEHVILTPHIGSYAKEARIMMERLAVKNLVEGL